MKKRTGIRVITTIVLTLMAALLLMPAALAEDGDYEHEYVSMGENGYQIGDYLTTLFELGDTSGTKNLAYCVDFDTYIVDHSLYARANLDRAGYFGKEAGAKVRAIIKSAYPFTSLDELRTASGLSDLTAQEAITAAQLSIWTAVSDAVFTCEHANINALCAYFAALAPLERAETPIADVELTCAVDGSQEAGYSALFRYRTEGKNLDGSRIALGHAFDRDIESLYGARVSAAQADGWTEVRVDGLPQDAIFDFSVSGVQTVAFDAYLYQPQGGRSASQSLVGAYNGTTKLAARAAFMAQPGDYSIRIYKYDSKTREGIEGAVFQLSNNADFADPILYERATDAEGYAEFHGLTEGRWYLREKSAPLGYVPDTEVYTYDIDEVPIDLIRFKNTHYGQIKILKSDDAGNPVSGALFNIYRGDSTDVSDLLYEDLMSDESGLILAGDLTPGVYTVLETEAPMGYHLAEEPKQAVTVEPHGTATVTMVNPLVERGRIGVAKQDYETGKRLPGAKIGIYTDPDCTVLLREIITVVDGDKLQYLEDLLPGVYFVKELEAPEGYILNPQQSVVQVELTEGEVEEVVFRNRPRIDTAGNYGLLLLIGAALVLVTGTLVFVFRKRLFKR